MSLGGVMAERAFYSTNDVAESKMAREMLRFTIETAVVGRESRMCEKAGVGCVRAMSALCSQHSAL